MRVKPIVKKVPLPICGVALAIAAIGIAVEPHVAWAYPLCAGLSCVLLALYLAKAVLYPSALRADLDNPVTAGVAGTLPMALLNLSTYLARVSWHAGLALWCAALALYVVLIVRFSVKFARRARIGDLTPACFVIYIGVLAAATTAPAFGFQAFGVVLALAGMLATVVLVLLVSARIVAQRLPEPLKPMMCIYAAPPSMCLAAYLSCAASPFMALSYALFALSCAFYLVGLVALVLNVRSTFYPTFAAMTFPFVIAATATAKFAAVSGTALVASLAAFQLVIASLATLYVLVRYAMFLVKD